MKRSRKTLRLRRCCLVVVSRPNARLRIRELEQQIDEMRDVYRKKKVKENKVMVSYSMFPTNLNQRFDAQEVKPRNPREKCKECVTNESQLIRLQEQLRDSDEQMGRMRCEQAVDQQKLEQLQQINEGLQKQMKENQEHRRYCASMIFVCCRSSAAQSRNEPNVDIEAVVGAMSAAHAKQVQKLNDEIRELHQRLQAFSNEPSRTNSKMAIVAFDLLTIVCVVEASVVEFKTEIEALRREKKTLSDQIIQLQFELERVQTTPVVFLFLSPSFQTFHLVEIYYLSIFADVKWNL